MENEKVNLSDLFRTDPEKGLEILRSRPWDYAMKKVFYDDLERRFEQKVQRDREAKEKAERDGRQPDV